MDRDNVGERIYIFDTTLRDGEQSPGASLGIDEKIAMAAQLEKLGIDVIEAGFPVASEGEFQSVQEIASSLKDPVIAALTRTTFGDIDRAWQALKGARRPRIHVFIATSDIHLQYKLKMTREEVLRQARGAVKHAKGYVQDVEFSAEDATRSDLDFLCRVVSEVVEAGATVVNIPDTVGYTVPKEYAKIISYLREKVPQLGGVVLSSHCHNDLGLAVANTLAGIENGVRQVECTINGIGERAGNASLEEIVMALKTRCDMLPYHTKIRAEEICRTSEMLSGKTGLLVAYNKPIVGRNAFAHEAGIHQHGVIQKALTYEIMTPESVGRRKSQLVLGKHSGKHGLRKRYQDLGYQLSDKEINNAYQRFIELADKKKEIFDEDLAAILEEEKHHVEEIYKLEYIHIISGNQTVPTATIKLSFPGGSAIDSATGDGPVDAAFQTISRITHCKGRLIDYSVRSVSAGKEAIGEAFVKLDFGERAVVGKGTSTDVIEASAKAYLNALNKHLGFEKRAQPGQAQAASIDV